jgi:hypothetical protein
VTGTLVGIPARPRRIHAPLLESNREGLAIEVGTTLPSVRVIA